MEWSRGISSPANSGIIVNDLLVVNFPDMLDVEFTARMEEDLDRIEAAEIDASAILSRFYRPSVRNWIDAAGEQMLSVKGVGLPTA